MIESNLIKIFAQELNQAAIFSLNTLRAFRTQSKLETGQFKLQLPGAASQFHHIFPGIQDTLPNRTQLSPQVFITPQSRSQPGKQKGGQGAVITNRTDLSVGQLKMSQAREYETRHLPSDHDASRMQSLQAHHRSEEASANCSATTFASVGNRGIIAIVTKPIGEGYEHRR